MSAYRLALLGPMVLLASCSDKGKDDSARPDLDPAVEQALGDELSTDPDMAGRNEAGAALSGTGNQGVPKINSSTQAIEAARTRALELLGGSQAVKRLPTARTLAAGAPDSAAMARAARAVVARGGANCATRVSYTAAWAAKLPTEFPIYPRANTQEAAGTDEGACALRAVTFRTPVPMDEVLTFYHNRALGAGYSSELAQKGGETILSGLRDRAAFVVYARELPDKITEIDLVTSTQ